MDGDSGCDEVENGEREGLKEEGSGRGCCCCRHCHPSESTANNRQRRPAGGNRHTAAAEITSGCYLAEVKMFVENNRNAEDGNHLDMLPSPAHIYVRPLLSRRAGVETADVEEAVMDAGDGTSSD